ncbi:MAG: carbamate kinase [Bacteroidales bacterium]|nr:carbamate kinase [Bacteroidales bacterium]
MMGKLAVIALGGNALLRDNQAGTIEEQEQNTTETLENIVFLLREGYDLVLTHGNGPQVGNILMRNDAGEQLYGIAQMPLDICVADSQGGIGYMIERVLHNVLRRHGIRRKVVTLVTEVVVDPEDRAFQQPEKRIGKIYSGEEAERLTREKGWIFKEEIKEDLSGWRRVVPSPRPGRVLNAEIMEELARRGHIVIAAGGGGIPVYFDGEGMARPSEAVIDKDLASSLLASTISADEFYILTDVPYVFLNYKQKNQQMVEFLDRADSLRYLEQGMFGEGNMAPKILAAVKFVENGGEKSVITEATKLEDKKYGTKITLHYDDKH